MSDRESAFALVVSFVPAGRLACRFVTATMTETLV